jgi:hypothetical protein
VWARLYANAWGPHLSPPLLAPTIGHLHVGPSCHPGRRSRSTTSCAPSGGSVAQAQNPGIDPNNLRVPALCSFLRQAIKSALVTLLSSSICGRAKGLLLHRSCHPNLPGILVPNPSMKPMSWRCACAILGARLWVWEFHLTSRWVLLASWGRKEPWGAMNCSMKLMSAAGPSFPVAG